MTGEEIHNKLRHKYGLKSDIRELKANPGFWQMQRPSDANFTRGVADSVTEQYHRIRADWDAQQKKLTLSLHNAGHGYWIPYLGNGAGALAGVAQTAGRGLGTYTAPLGPGGPVTWVATGPFSGCSLATFSPAGGNKVFAHVITPAAGYTADTVVNQVANIAAQVNSPAPAQGAVQQVVSAHGEGFVFWTLVNGVWRRRVIYTLPGGKVSRTESSTQV